jgi:hypothetical protein
VQLDLVPIESIDLPHRVVHALDFRKVRHQGTEHRTEAFICFDNEFTDFLKVGIPLNLSIGLLASALIPFFWPL